MTNDPLPKISDVIRTAVTEAVKFDCSGSDENHFAFHPPVDVKETPTEVVVYVDLPGVDEDELQFCWRERELCICGMRDFNHDTEDAEEFTRIERTFGSFKCQIPLDATVDIDRTTAKYRRGVLKVILPRFKPLPKPRPAKRTQLKQADKG